MNKICIEYNSLAQELCEELHASGVNKASACQLAKVAIDALRTRVKSEEAHGVVLRKIE